MFLSISKKLGDLTFGITLVLYKHLFAVSCNISSSFNKLRYYLHISVSCCELGFQPLSVPTHSRFPSRSAQNRALRSQPTISLGYIILFSWMVMVVITAI